MRRAIWFLWLWGCNLLGDLADCRADEFILNSGARVRGEWVNRSDRQASFYLVTSEFGGQFRLDRTQVVEVQRQRAEQRDYERIAPSYTDTETEQWRLAEWCRQHELTELADSHLRRVLELNPEHVAARRALGYAEIGGQWVLPHEHRVNQGYVRYKGKWQLAQEIELAESRRREELAKKEWYAQLKLWRSQLGKEKQHAALSSIREVRDPWAIEALSRLLRMERDRRVRLVYVEALGHIDDSQSTATLIELCLHDYDEEVYHACIDRLVPRVTPIVLKQFVAALKHPRNDVVNRAALALSRLGDRSVVPPLIEALVTRHEQTTPSSGLITTTFASGPQSPLDPRGSTSGAASPTFLSPGGGSQVSGAASSPTITLVVANQVVLQSLVKLTGNSFGFDQRAWRNWYTIDRRQQQNAEVDARRTP